MKLATVEKKTFLAGLQCTLTSSCAKTKMRNFNSLIVPNNVKGGPLGFLNIHSVAKHQKRRDPLKTLKNFEKKSHKAEKGAGKVS